MASLNMVQHKCNIGIGSAQFGMQYGISNRIGRQNKAGVAHILEKSQVAGIQTVDCAVGYGDAEFILGEIGVKYWRVITKIPPVHENVRDIEGWMEAQLTASLSRLKIPRVSGLLLHAPSQMRTNRAKAIACGLNRIAERGLAERVGVSIQHPDRDLPPILAHMKPGLIQAPFNLLDDSLVTKGWAKELNAIGCEVHTRSAFLQGLLLMSREERPQWFERWAPFWEAWHNWLNETGLTPQEACLRYVLTQDDIDCCIVGVDSADQLQELLSIGREPLPSLPRWPGTSDEDLITPSRWFKT